MFVVGSAGSTAGFVKIIRILILWKLVKREISKILHPRAVIPVKIKSANLGAFFIDKITVYNNLSSHILFLDKVKLSSGTKGGKKVKNVTISAKRYVEQFRYCLEDKLKPLKQLGVSVNLTEEYKGNMTFLGCSINNSTLSNMDYERMAVDKIAEALSSYIVDVLEKPLIEKTIKSTCVDMSEKDQNSLYIKSLELVTAKNRQFRRDQFLKKEICKKLIEYFDKQWQINIEGFVRFRLQGYMENIQEIIDEAKEEVIIEKEYNDFIKLLKYFVEIQEAKIEDAHLIKKNDKYLVIGEGSDTIAEERCEDINGSDGIISCLVTYAPKRVIIHIKDFYTDEEVLVTVNSIFDERVVLCLGCNMCANDKKNREEAVEELKTT